MNIREPIIAVLAIVVVLVVISTCVCSCGYGYGYRRPIGRLSYLDCGGEISDVEIVSCLRITKAGIEVVTVDGDRIFTSCFSLKLY